MSEEIVLMDIEKIDPPAEADRDLIDPDKIRELAESIRSQGLHSPILLRPVNSRYEIVFGHRRFLAHRLIGEVKIRSMIKEMTNDQVFEARAVENDQREDLNPIERAKSYRRLRERFGMSNRQIAQKMGRSFSVIDKYFRLLEVPEEFQDAIAKKRISMQVALILNEIDDEGFRKFYFSAAVENGATMDLAEAWLNDWRKTQAGTAYNEVGGNLPGGVIQECLPIYQTCYCCGGPEDVKTIKYIPLCANCQTEVRGALKRRE